MTPQTPLLEHAPRPNGYLDIPQANTVLTRGPVVIAGWALFPDAPTARVEVRLGNERLGLARLGIPRLDLSAQTGLAAAGIAGFELATDISEWAGRDGETTIDVVAVSTAGERHPLGPVPVSVVPASEPSPAPLRRPTLPTSKRSGGDRMQVLVCTHQLNLGGAQLYLLDLLRALIERDDVDLVVVSAIDGSLREELEDLGAAVHISSLIPVDNIVSHLGRVEELSAWAAGWDFDVVLINTATALAFPGAEVAERLGIPAIWMIHESFAPALLWANLDDEVRQRAEAILACAALLLFETESTQRLYEPLATPGRCLTLPYGLDLGPIDAVRDSFDRSAARREAGIPADAEVVLCIGTVEPRKAQVPLVQAFALIADRHPEARLVLVGAGDSNESLVLADYIETLGASDRVELIPITPNVQRWYGLADLLVCASDVESTPRTVLEAMAWETPVLATNVYGLPELIDDGETGWLCAPRDVVALAEALDKALRSTAEERRRMGSKARALVERRHSLEGYGREVGRLLDRVASRAHATPATDLARP
jgi:D-inositol-3-phosphate glycosyltransferase